MFFGGNCTESGSSDCHLCLYTEAVSPSPFLRTPVPPSLHSRPLNTKQNIWFPCLERSMGLPSHFVFMPVRTLASRHGWYLASSPACVLLTSSSFSLLWLHPVPPACSHLWIFTFVWCMQSVLLAPPSLLWISASVSPSHTVNVLPASQTLDPWACSPCQCSICHHLPSMLCAHFWSL